MQDKELYQYILRLASRWSVASVATNVNAQEIVVQVEYPRGMTFGCSDCQRELPCYDHAGERRWWHLDSCQFITL
jgi:hypothetical protein